MLNKNLIGIITNYVGFYKGINFNIPFFKKHLDKVYWSMLSENTNIPVTFFEKHISSCKQLGVPDKVNWYMLSRNTNIPLTFFEKHISSCEQLGVPDKVNWSMLSGNTNIPKHYNLIKLKEILYNYKI